ncbi:MAG TPA: hypothetical protein PK098_07190 [Phycisphaerales bacterium]|nr:hypothetical protein [Phycisphaerales bacterium]
MLSIYALIAALTLQTPIFCMVAQAPPCCDGCAKRAAEAAKNAGVDSLDALLTHIEHSGQELRAFTADVRYEIVDELLGRREIRTGEMIYRVDDAAGKSFAVLFDRLMIPPRSQTRLRHYIFSDRWLVEVDHEAKQFIKREIVAPGQQLDPLKLGEGPIPLPIGQPKDEVLARFDASLIEAPPSGSDDPMAGLRHVDGLRLVPKKGTSEAREYEQVDIFYDRATWLPVGIHAIEVGGNRKIVRLNNLAHNPTLSAQQLAKLSVKEPDPRQWAIDVQAWRGSN